MSANVPYIAPWQSGFEKFATQLYTPTSKTLTSAVWTVAATQWWRFIFIFANMTTSGTAGTRAVLCRFQASAGATPLDIYTPYTQPASIAAGYAFGPALQAYSNGAGTGSQFAVAPIPDIMWGPGSVITVLVSGPQSGDLIITSQAGVEVYTEQRLGVLAPAALAPTPLLA